MRIVELSQLLMSNFQAEEWNERAEKFHEGVSRVQHLASTFKEIPNQSIHYYFYPYLWDILGVLQTCSTFVRWLGKLSERGVVKWLHLYAVLFSIADKEECYISLLNVTS